MVLREWLYRGRRPNRVARALDRATAALSKRGVGPDDLVALEVRGRRTARTERVPLVTATVGDERYLVSMLGDGSEWVRNVRAANGEATLCHGACERVSLVEVPPEDRAPVLQAYLARARNARTHVPVDPDAPLAEFARIASAHPVFRIESREATRAGSARP
jgi:hypothetical protein